MRTGILAAVCLLLPVQLPIALSFVVVAEIISLVFSVVFSVILFVRVRFLSKEPIHWLSEILTKQKHHEADSSQHKKSNPLCSDGVRIRILDGVWLLLGRSAIATADCLSFVVAEIISLAFSVIFSVIFFVMVWFSSKEPIHWSSEG